MCRPGIPFGWCSEHGAWCYLAPIQQAVNVILSAMSGSSMPPKEIFLRDALDVIRAKIVFFPPASEVSKEEPEAEPEEEKEPEEHHIWCNHFMRALPCESCQRLNENYPMAGLTPDEALAKYFPDVKRVH